MRDNEQAKAPGVVPGIVSAASHGFRNRGERDRNPTMQMSVRMREDVYEKFRALAEQERRTNGDMLERMMEAYLASKK